MKLSPLKPDELIENIQLTAQLLYQIEEAINTLHTVNEAIDKEVYSQMQISNRLYESLHHVDQKLLDASYEAKSLHGTLEILHRQIQEMQTIYGPPSVFGLSDSTDVNSFK